MRELRLWAAAAAGPVVAAGFYALAAPRRGGALHPTGIGYQGWLQVPNERLPRPGVPLSRPVRRIRPCFASLGVLACLSCSDALGVIKLPDAHGPGVDQDLLLTSSSDRPLLRRLLFPSTSFVRGRSPPPCPMTSAANGSCCCWSQRPSVPGGPPAGRGIVLSSVPWLNWVPSPPAAWSWSYEPPGPSAAPSRWPP